MFCPKCGAPLAEGAAFCSACGARLDGSPAPAPAPAVPQQGDAGAPPRPGVTGASQSQPGSPVPPVPGTTPGQGPSQRQPRTPGSRKPLLVGIAAVIVVLLAVVALFTVGPFGSGELALPGQEAATKAAAYSDNLSPDRYTLNDPELDLEDNYIFELPLNDGTDLGLDAPSEEGSDFQAGAVTGAARVYSDGALTQEFPIEVTQVKDEDGNRLEVAPDHVWGTDASGETGYEDVDPFHSDEATGDSWATGRWYGFGGYYLVRYVGADGQQLEKPEVTYFTVENDVDDAESPLSAVQNVRTTVSENGTLAVSWDPVEGADHYEVWMQAVDKTTEDPPDRYAYTLLASTSDTQIDTLDYDTRTKDRQERAKEYQYEGDAAADSMNQNAQFEDLVINDNEDDVFGNRADAQEGVQGLQVADYVPNADTVKATSVSVVAVGADGSQSPYSFQSINDLLGQMPITYAYYTAQLWQEQLPDEESDPVGYLKKRLTYWTVMADGTVVGHRCILDTANMKTTDAELIHGPDENNLTRSQTTRYSIPYTVEGSVLTDSLNLYELFWPGGADAINAAAQEAVEQQLAEAPATGALQRAQYEGDIDWNAVAKNQKAATEPADVPYQVNGQSEFVRFIASNLLAGNNFLDVTYYVSQAGSASIQDALDEAVAQNPLTMLSSPTFQERVEDGRTLITITDFFYSQLSDAAALNDLRAQANQKADEIVSSVITDGMTDSQKVDALNDAVTNAVDYDRDFFNTLEKSGSLAVMGWEGAPNTIQGLVNGRGLVVCSGYAGIFKVLCDKAGIDCVVVNGEVPATEGIKNNGHAWNLVNVDGSWKVVDSTWNDTDDGSANQSDDEYLLLDQTDVALAGRTYDSDALLDNTVEEYVDPSLIVS